MTVPPGHGNLFKAARVRIQSWQIMPKAQNMVGPQETFQKEVLNGTWANNLSRGGSHPEAMP